MTKEDWRTTLFVWDGILSFVENEETEEKKAESGIGEESEELSKGADSLRIRWRGTWIGCNEADAAKVPTPKRGAFDEYVSSDHTFEVEGAVSRVATTDDGVDVEYSKGGDGGNVVGGDASTIHHRVDMTGGTGYELGEGNEKETHHDDRHDVFFFSPTLRWSGKLRNQLTNLVLAVGDNEFGHFLSVGWLRVGNRVTLARRYVDEDDERSGWDVEDLTRAVLEQIATTAVDGHVEIVIPPWQCVAMHADARHGSKRQKITSKSDS
jgi:hypothetical protein